MSNMQFSLLFQSEEKKERYQKAVYINATRMKRDIEIGKFIPANLDTKLEEKFSKALKTYEEEMNEYFGNLNAEDIQGDVKHK